MARRLALALIAAAALWACEASSPAQLDEGPEIRLGTVPVLVTAPPAIAALAVTVSAPDIASELVFNVTMVDGAAQDTLVIPTGSARTVTVRGFDTQSIETHRGQKVIDVTEGPNTPLTIFLRTLAAEVPLVIGLGSLEIRVGLPRDTLSLGGTVRASAVVTDQAGDTLPIAVRWAVLHPAVATVDSAGALVGVGEGSTSVVATFGGTVGVAALAVVAPRPVALELTPDSARFTALGDTTRIRAWILDQFGDTIVDGDVLWRSSDERVARVDAGMVTAAGAGVATISAEIDSLVATASVAVVQRAAAISLDVTALSFGSLGDTARVQAVVEDAGGSAIEGAAVTWASSNASIATVTQQGLVTALAQGSVQLTAAHDSLSATLPVQVSQIPTSVTVSPDTVISFTIGETVTFVATERDAGGSPLPPSGGWVWNSDFDAVVSIDPVTGVATSLGYGTAGITAARSGAPAVGRATMTVALTGSEVRLSRSTATLLPGDTVHLKATVFDDAGVQLWDRNAYVAWASSDPAVASVAPGCAQARCTAVVTARSLGGATITATSGTGSAAVQVTVAEQIPASIVVTPAARTLTAIGDARMFYAQVFDADGVEIPGAPVRWSSNAPSVAAIDSTGLVVAVAEGSAVITASSGSVSSQASVTVAVTLVNLTVAGVHLNQGNQSAAGDIPGVVGRAGLLRVIVQADQINNFSPTARVSLYDGGQLIRQEVLAAPRQGVPLQPDLGVLSDTWNLTLDASEAVADLDVVVELDPGGLIPESDEIDNIYAGPVEMRSLAPLRLVFFPIQSLVQGTTGNISSANASTMLASTAQWIPTSSITYVIRDPIITSQDLSTADGWSNLLSELQAVRAAEGAADQYYHGIVGDFANPAWGGLAYRASSPSSTFRSGLSYDRPSAAPGTIAHELGHNLGRPHAPCGNPANIESAYPYPDGTIGQPGFDSGSGTLVAASTFDYMSYCAPEWTSDWAFGQIVSWRTNDPLVPAGAPAPVSESVPTGAQGLLVYGRMTAQGVSLEPAFTVDTPPGLALPAPGAHELRALSTDGGEVLRLSFESVPVEDGDGGVDEHFAFVVPLAEAELNSIARLEVSSPFGTTARSAAAVPDAPAAAASLAADPDGRIRARWNASLYPSALIRDRQSGEIRGIVRGGDVRFDPLGRPAEDFELVLSDGVRSNGVAR